MEYCEFLEQIRHSVHERTEEGDCVRIAPVRKNNQNYKDTLTILSPHGNTAPAIYMEPYYQQYLEGSTLDEVADQILEFHREHAKRDYYDISFYTDYAMARECVVCKLINYERNREMLRDLPHRRFLDLAVVYYCRIDDETFGKASILVCNEHLAMWGTDQKKLDDAAMSNTARLLPYVCCPISDVLREMTGIEIPETDGSIPMYVLTNTEKYFGAATILYNTILEAAAERLGGDFYVLPSSIHECMLVPVTERVAAAELQKMVREINGECVGTEDFLSSSVYRYSTAAGELRIAAQDLPGDPGDPEDLWTKEPVAGEDGHERESAL